MMQDEPELPEHRPPDRKADWSKAELLDLVTRSAGATMAVVDRSLTMIYVNDEYARWFGTVPHELVGKTLVDVYGEPDCLRFMPFVERVLQGERVQYQRLLHTPYGFDEWRTICLTPWHGPQGGIEGFITTALDVHELQVTMNALRAANQRLSSHMENSPLAVLEMDHNLRLLHCSQRAVQLMGWLHVAGLEGRLLTDLLDLPPAPPGGLPSTLVEVLDGGCCGSGGGIGCGAPRLRVLRAGAVSAQALRDAGFALE